MAGVCVVGGMCGRGCVAGGYAWQERRPVQRTARILLECILASHKTSSALQAFMAHK